MMRLTTQQETMIRLGTLMLPGMIVMMWIGDLAGDGEFAMAGLGGLAAGIVTGLGYFFFHKRSLKAQVIASVAATTVLIVAIPLSLNTPAQRIRREILGHWESVPRENELDEPMTMWFATSKQVKVGFGDLHLCEYEIRHNELVLKEKMNTSRMKIVLLRNDSLRLETEDQTILFVRKGD